MIAKAGIVFGVSFSVCVGVCVCAREQTIKLFTRWLVVWSTTSVCKYFVRCVFQCKPKLH